MVARIPHVGASTVLKQRKSRRKSCRRPLLLLASLVFPVALLVLVCRHAGILMRVPTLSYERELNSNAYDAILLPHPLHGSSGRSPHLFVLSAYFDSRMVAYGRFPSVFVLGILYDGLKGAHPYKCISTATNGASLELPAVLHRFPMQAHNRELGYSSIYVECVFGDADFRKVYNSGVRLLEVNVVPQGHEWSGVKAEGEPWLPVRYFPSGLLPPASLGGNMITLAVPAPASLCIKPGSGDTHGASLRPWVAAYKALGVSRFFLYNSSFAGETSNIVHDLARDPSISLIQFRAHDNEWVLQRQNEYIYETGQIIAHQDCLYRSIGNYRWVVFVDLDEYILGRQPAAATLGGILYLAAKANASQTVDPSSNVCLPSSFIFLNTFFHAECNVHNPSMPLGSSTHRVLGFPPPVEFHVRGPFFAPPTRTKSVADPTMVLIHGTHFVQRFVVPNGPIQPIVESWLAERSLSAILPTCKPHDFAVPTDIGALHHYRQNVPPQHVGKKNCVPTEAFGFTNYTYVLDYTPANMYMMIVNGMR